MQRNGKNLLQRLTASGAGCLAMLLLLAPAAVFADAQDTLKSGTQLLAQGQLDSALLQLRTAAENLPESVEAKLALGECLLKLGRSKEALEQYKAVLKLSPKHTAASQIVAALTGASDPASQLAGAELLMKIGDYERAFTALRTIISRAPEAQQLQRLQLLRAEAELWSAQNTHSHYATTLLADEKQQAIGKVMIALSSALSKPLSEDVQAELKALKLPAPWDKRAQFAIALGSVEQTSDAAVLSGAVAKTIGSIPQSDYRRKAARKIYAALLREAGIYNQQRETSAARAILWPMVSSTPMPGAAGGKLVVSGGWLDSSFDSTAREVVYALSQAGQVDAARKDVPQATLSFRMAMAVATQIKLVDAREKLFSSILNQAASSLLKKDGSGLNEPVEEVLREMSIAVATQAVTENVRQAGYHQLLAQLQRFHEADQTAAALSKLVSADADGNAKLTGPLAKAVIDTSHRNFLVQLASVAHAVAKAKQENTRGVWQINKGAALDSDDALAIDLLRKAGVEHKEASKQFHQILDAYKQRGQVAAATAAIKRFYQDAAEQQTWSLIAFSLEQARLRDAELAAGNQALPGELPEAVTSVIKQIEASLKENSTQENQQRAKSTLESLVQYYTGKSRKDLASAVLKAIDAEGPLAVWVIWQQTQQLHAQAEARLQEQVARAAGAAPEALVESHAAELKLISQILNDHAESTYVRPAVDRVSAIVQKYLQLKAFDVAQSVVKQFVAAHPKLANIEALEFQVVEIAIAKADLEFSRREADAPVPAELPALYVQAMKDLTAYLQKHPEGAGTRQAETQTLAIMQKLGRAGAWQAAREALKVFVAAAKNYHPPQRLEMYRAATFLGELDNTHGVSLLAGQWNGPQPQGQILVAGRDTGVPGSGIAGGGFGGEAPQAELPPGALAPPTVNGGLAANGPGAQPGDDPFGYAAPNGAPQQAVPQPSILPPSEPNQTALALIRRSQQQRFTQLAMLDQRRARNQQQAANNEFGEPGPLPNGALLSTAELKRQDQAADNAYTILLKLTRDESETVRDISKHARQQILWMFGFFEGQQRPDRAHELIVKYLADQPEDPARLALHYQAIQNQLSAAGQQAPGQRIDLAWLDKRDAEFQKAREAIAAFAKEYKDQKDWAHKARLLAVASFETEASLASSISPERAGGFLVNAAQALFDLYQSKPTHPGVSGFPQRLYNLAERLYSTGQRERAIYVHSRISVFFPVSPLAAQSVLRMAQLHAADLSNPLRAVETYQEYMSLTGQEDAVKSQIYSIAQQLSNGGRYLEALHVFGVFVDSFPVDARACQALQAIGQVHQANEVWNEALATYERVLDEYPNCAVIADVKLTMAECHINLSQWDMARKIYEEFPRLYGKHAQAKTATARLPVLKQLARYQSLLEDEAISRNKDDAQFQIARIVLSQLNNQIKAIEEFGKVVKNHPKSDLADDAQLEIGKALLALNRRDEARDALRLVAKNYETSPSADDALYLIGKSYEQQAQSLATVTQESAWKFAFERNQRGAYAQFNDALARQTREQTARRKQLKSEGKSKELGLNEAADAFRYNGVNYDNISNSARNAVVLAQTESALQVANKQDRINDAYREAVAAYLQVAANYPLGDKTDDSLLEIAQIYETKLKDRTAAMATYQRVVKLFPGTPVAEDAAWKVAEFYSQEDKFTAAATAYREFIRNYPASGRVADAQFALAETLEQLGKWVDAMDAYEVFRQKFSSHAKARLAADQINWIKAYRK